MTKPQRPLKHLSHRVASNLRGVAIRVDATNPAPLYAPEDRRDLSQLVEPLELVGCAARSRTLERSLRGDLEIQREVGCRCERLVLRQQVVDGEAAPPLVRRRRQVISVDENNLTGVKRRQNVLRQMLPSILKKVAKFVVSAHAAFDHRAPQSGAPRFVVGRLTRGHHSQTGGAQVRSHHSELR